MSADQGVTKTAGYPVEKRMSARFEGTFAYLTLRDRMPRILTQVIDTVNREEKNVAKLHGEAGTEDVKAVLAQFSKLRYELTTDKAMEPIESGEDLKAWAMVFDKYRAKFQGENPQWFAVSWLFAECYMYRKIVEILRNSSFLKDFDPFDAQKQLSFTSSLPQISSIATFLSGLLQANDSKSSDQIKIEFEHLVLISLWGNKMDLSMIETVDNYDITQAQHVSSETSSTQQTQLMRTNLLSDHTSVLWDLVQLLRQPKTSSEPRRIDFVLDNCGLELFSDVCLADWLLSTGLADKIMLHFKQMPWFVSDALIKDFHWTMNELCSSKNTHLSTIGERWKRRIREGSFILTDHIFWTTSFEYAAMESVASDLYNILSKSYLVIFKGDLNYRKLLADRNWLYTENFSIALGGFEPTNVCALRTLKADLVTGLPPGAAAKAAGESKDWMVTGQYAVCQVNKK